MSSKTVVYPDPAKVKKLGNLMKEKDVEAVSNQIKDWLHRSECPFTTALDVLKKSNFKDSRKLSVFEIVAKHLQSYNAKHFAASKRFKNQAVALIGEFYEKSKNNLLESFGFDPQGTLFVERKPRSQTLRDQIMELLANRKLEDEIIENVIVPILTYSNKINPVLKYVGGESKETQIKMIEAVDKLVSELIWVESTNKDDRLIKKLLVFYEKLKREFSAAYSEAETRNFEAVVLKKANKTHKQNDKTINFIGSLVKKWKSNRMTGSSLESYIFRYVGDDNKLLEDVACLVEMRYDDKERADLLRRSLQPGSARTPIWSDDEEIPIGDHQLKLAIPIENVVFVDSEEKLIVCLNYLKENEPSDGELLPIGFDAEWIMSPPGDKDILALIQFAVKDRVYLIDFARFRQENCQVLAQLMQHVFRSENFVVLGFGIDNDKTVFENHFAGRIWAENSMDFSKSRNCEMFSEFGRDTEFAGKKLKSFSSLCLQVDSILYRCSKSFDEKV